MGEGVAVTPGNKRRVQVRKARKDGFSEEKRQIFLDHLAGCCNVTRAAAAAGVSAVTVNYHRRRDPVFDRQCEDALATGYDNLEAMLVERAAGGGRYLPGPEAATAPGPEGMDTELGLRLLSLRHAPPRRRTGRAGYEPKRASEKELDDWLVAKLDVLDRRLTLRRRSGQAKGKAEKGKKRTAVSG